MNNQHLQSFIAICENDFSATAAAAQTGDAQSSLSKRVHAIEKEIGAPLFARRGRRYLGLTPAGEAALRVAREIMLKQENLRAIGAAYAGDTMRGALRVGATHLQARYLLPQIVSSFRRDYPNVSLRIIQGAPSRLARMALDNAVDIAICTEELDAHAPPLRVDFLYSWNRALIASPAHPLAKKSKITLADLCSYPLVTYERGFTGRAAFDAALRESKLRPAIVVSASDTDIVKTYVRLGVGAGVISEIACEAEDAPLVHRPLSHLFAPMRAKIARRADKFLTAGGKRFIELCIERAPAIAKNAVAPRKNVK